MPASHSAADTSQCLAPPPYHTNKPSTIAMKIGWLVVLVPPLRRCDISRHYRFAICWALTLICAASMHISPAVGQTINREILALYDSKEEGPAIQSRIHRFVEMPLNHLGYSVTLVDLHDGLPDAEATTPYYAIVTWLKQQVPDTKTYFDWLTANLGAGRKLIVLGHLGINSEPAQAGLRQRIFASLGLRPSGNWNVVTFDSKLHKLDERFFKFEASLSGTLPQYPDIELISGQAEPLLQLSRRNYDGTEQISTLAATNAAGGYIAEGFEMREYPTAERVRWIVNPFAFFRSALKVGRFPIPDVTTIAGRRVYFSHIDGDGWNNVSDIEKYRKKRTLSSEVVYHELIKPYPDLPVTVGLISGDVDRRIGGVKDSAAIARALFALPQVEVGSHTHSHPFNWSYFKNYDRANELALIDRVQQRSQTRASSIMNRLGLSQLISSDQYQRQRFISGSSDLPRTYMHRPFDLQAEIRGSLRIAQSLAPPGKRAKLLQWSGDTTPFEAALATVRATGARNINGGDSRFDTSFPSAAYVPPIGRKVGSQRQIYAVNSNENTYTNDWTENFFGLAFLEETLRNTQASRRLKGFNLYYHMYSGEHPAALAAVKSLLQLARRSPVIPIPASDYAAIADSFFDVDIQQLEAGVWRIANRGTLNTVRLDDAAKLTIDLQRSRGVVGFRRLNGSIYVALDSAVKPALVALSPGSANPATDLPYLVESRWQISKLKRTQCGAEFSATGFGTSQMTWHVPAQKGYKVQVSRAGLGLWAAALAPTRKGKLIIDAPIDARKSLVVSIECQ